MTFTLTTEAARHPAVFAEAFNSGDPDLLDRVYEADAVLVTADGTAVTGDARRAANDALQRLGRPIEVRPRHVHVAGGLALLVVDWSIGREVRGTATDVARRGADGKWRYVIDNPFGVAG